LLLILILILGLLPVPPRAGQAIGDDRVLRVQDGAAERHYRVPELIDAIGLTELRVAKDPHFGPDRVFSGFALEPLLNHIGLGDASELLLVCADGYRIPFDASAIKPPLRGLLALRDTALPADGEVHWEGYRHGAEIVNFDPFYLVWAGAYERLDPDTEALPWPFQLTGIQRFDRDAYYAPARPPAGGAAGDLQKGFALYTAHCGKCHRMRGVGGDVGPALDREGSLSSLFTTAQLRDYVRHEESRFPQSKMPPFSTLLSPAQIDQVVAYLQAMQPAK
jgi:mono/diheme cytochrome c family protein